MCAVLRISNDCARRRIKKEKILVIANTGGALKFASAYAQGPPSHPAQAAGVFCALLAADGAKCFAPLLRNRRQSMSAKNPKLIICSAAVFRLVRSRATPAHSPTTRRRRAATTERNGEKSRPTSTDVDAETYRRANARRKKKSCRCFRCRF